MLSFWLDTYLFHSILATLAILMTFIGVALVLKGYFSKLTKGSQKKHNYKIPLIKGSIGVILLFFAGLIVIYLYSQLPPSERIIEDSKDKKTDELPDISHITLSKKQL